MWVAERDIETYSSSGTGSKRDLSLLIAVVGSFVFHLLIVVALTLGREDNIVIVSEPLNKSPLRIRMVQRAPVRDAVEDVPDETSEAEPETVAETETETETVQTPAVLLANEVTEEIAKALEEIPETATSPELVLSPESSSQQPVLPEPEPSPTPTSQESAQPTLRLPSLYSLRETVDNAVRVQQQGYEENWYLDCDILDRKNPVRKCDDEGTSNFVVKSVEELKIYQTLIASLDAGTNHQTKLRKLIQDTENLENRIRQGELPDGLSNQILSGLRELIELNTNNRDRAYQFYRDQIDGDFGRQIKRIMGYSF